MNGSTHRSGHTFDLVISRHNEQLFQNVDVLPRFAGDHSPILCTLRQPAPSKLRKTVRQRKLKNIDINCFTDDIKTSELITSPISNLQDAIQQYNDVLSDLPDTHAPFKEKTVKIDHKAPWFNDDIYSAREKRRRLERTGCLSYQGC